MDQIILKYLMDELTEEERQKLSAWLKIDPMNKIILEKFELHWRAKKPDLESQKSEVLRTIKSQIKDESPVTAKHTLTRRMLKYAAIFLLAFAGYYLLEYFSVEEPVREVRYVEKTSLDGQKINFKLSDGSVVKLNAGSKLIVPEVFDGQTRVVELEGEAFFDVAKNPDKPFIIRMEDFTVEVKGTSFNVRAYPEEDNKVVAVRSGVVAVSGHRNGKSVALLPNEMSVLSISEQTIQKQRVQDVDLIFGWIDQNLVFKNQSLDEILTMITKWYGVEVIMENHPGASDKQYTAKHEGNPTLQQVMESVAFVFEFEFEINGNDLIIK